MSKSPITDIKQYLNSQEIYFNHHHFRSNLKNHTKFVLENGELDCKFNDSGYLIASKKLPENFFNPEKLELIKQDLIALGIAVDDISFNPRKLRYDWHPDCNYYTNQLSIKILK